MIFIQFSVIDPFPFGGGVTTVDIFSAGTPILTLDTNDLRGLMTAHMYDTMNLPDLIANSIDNYIDLAGRLINEDGYSQTMRYRINACSGRVFQNINAVYAWEDVLMRIAGAHGILDDRLRVPGHGHSNETTTPSHAISNTNE